MEVLHYDFDYATEWAYAQTEDICLVRDERACHEALHKHSYYEIVYVYNGSGVQIINDISYPVHTGCIMLFDPEDCHSFDSVEELSMIRCASCHVIPLLLVATCCKAHVYMKRSAYSAVSANIALAQCGKDDSTCNL